MNVPKQPVHLAIAFDSNYLRHFYALFTSVLHTNRKHAIHVHAIITGVDADEQKRIQQYATANGAAISFYEIDEAFAQQFVLTGTWSSAVYYRLFFPLLVPASVRRLLYLDTDTIVLNDLMPLYTTDFEGYPVAAVYDNWVKTAPQLGIPDEGNYFNSGMMLINVPVWNEQQVSQQVFAYLAAYPERIKYVDQCGLNAVLVNNWKKLHFRFNVLSSRIPEGLSKKGRAAFLRDKVVLHYTLDRPWKMLSKHPYRHLYFQYLHQSPYRIVRKYDDYSLKKLPAFLRIRLLDLYDTLPVIKFAWQNLKSRLIGRPDPNL